MAEKNDDFVVFQRGQDEDNSDIWDDSALIKAYDNAVSIMKSHVEDKTEENANVHKKKKKKRSKKSPSSWKVGDICQAMYTVDNVIYEAEILSIDHTEKTCFVRYNDYGNEEEHKIEELKPLGRKQKQKHKKLQSDAASEAENMDCSAPHQSPHPSHSYSAPNQPGWPQGTGMPSFGGLPQMPFPFPGGPMFPGWSPMHPGSASPRIPSVPPPPPPPLNDDLLDGDNETLCSMLMSWYMSGYHTGYYQGLKRGRQQVGFSQTPPRPQTKKR